MEKLLSLCLAFLKASMGSGSPSKLSTEARTRASGVFPILVDVSISARCNHCEGIHPEDFPEWRPVAIPLLSIRCLRLLLFKTPWVPGCFQNLVEFFLHEQWHTDFDPPMETFLGILESSPQLAVLSVANAGPRLPVDTITLPPATRTAHLRNLRRLYLEQQDACNVGWMLIHLKIPISADVRIFVDLESGGRPVVSLELAFNLALPNHPGFPHFTNLRNCTYGVYNNLRNCSYALHFEPSCIISAPNLFFHITWNGTVRRHFGGLMMPFLCRAMAVRVIEDLTIVHDHPTGDSTSTLQWDLIFDTLHSLRKLRVKQSPGQLDLSVRAMFQSFSSPALQDLRLSFLVFDEKSQEKEKSGDRNELAESLVNWCAERDRRGCRLNRLVIEAPLNPPPGLGSLLTPHVDHIEISGKRLDNDDLWDVEFGSRQIFHYLRACRQNVY